MAKRTIVISGSESGIGLAARKRLEASDADIIGVDLAPTASVRANLGTPEGRREAVAAILERADKIDGLVLAAGIATGRPADVVSVNYFGVIALLEGLRDALSASEEAKCVVISSNASAIRPDLSLELIDALNDGDEENARALADKGNDRYAYGAAKYALIRWARRVAVRPEWAGAGIRVNLICPGVTLTPMAEFAIDNPNALKEWMSRNPLPAGRFADPDEIAAWCEALLSPMASYLIGQAIYVDGGHESVLRSEHWPAVWSA